MTSKSQGSVLNEKEIEQLNELSIGMLGYGAQGGAEAKNLKKSGIQFHLGLRKGGNSFDKAKSDGFSPKDLEETVQKSEWLFFNLPDECQARVYQELIRNSDVKYLIFAHGFNTHFGLIEPKESEASHVLIAPKGAASGLERLYSKAQALPAILGFRSASKTPPSESEKDVIELLARAVGAHSQGLFWADFKDETVCDLFSEQAILCGGVSSLLRKSFEVLVEAGYNEETAYFETLYELKLIVDLIWQSGINGMRSRISPTARYGDLTRGDRVIDDKVKNNMKEILKEIESGDFAREFLEKNQSDELKSLAAKQASHQIELVGKKLRERLQPSH